MKIQRPLFYGSAAFIILTMTLVNINFNEVKASPVAGGITGMVTVGGEPTEGIYLALFQIQTTEPMKQIAVTQTQENGVYVFSDVPTLEGLAYQVYFFNNDYGNIDNPDHLAFWVSKTIENYEMGESIKLNAFDISNLKPCKPVDGARIKLPYTYTWQPYSLSLSQYSYWFFNQRDDVVFSKNLTTPTITMMDLPDGVEIGDQNKWAVGIFTLDAGYGFTTEHPVVFVNEFKVYLPAVISK